MFLTAVCQPFVNGQLLRLELMSLSLCFFTFWVGSMLVTDPRGGEGTPLTFSLAAGSVAALNVAGVGGLVYTFATSFWKEKGAALMGWLQGKITGACGGRCGGRCGACCWPSGSRRRLESNVELLSPLEVGREEGLNEYSPLDDGEST
jgi:hypothetical protein